MLEYNCERERPHFLAVDPVGAIKECMACGVSTDKSLWVRKRPCPSCGFTADWDWNAAWKILMNLIEYKAREHGLEVEMPDERGTSLSCSVCGHEDGDSRVERGLWKCDRCGVVARGDVNRADNIRQKTLPVTPLLWDSGNGCLA